MVWNLTCKNGNFLKAHVGYSDCFFGLTKFPTLNVFSLLTLRLRKLEILPSQKLTIHFGSNYGITYDSSHNHVRQNKWFLSLYKFLCYIKDPNVVVISCLKIVHS